MAQDGVARQGDYPRGKATYHIGDACELRAEKVVGINPLRDAEDDEHDCRSRPEGQTQQAEGRLPLVARVMAPRYLAVYDIAYGATDVPDALRDFRAPVEEADAAQADETLHQEVVQARGKGLRQIIDIAPEAIDEHLAQKGGAGNSNAFLLRKLPPEQEEADGQRRPVRDIQALQIGRHLRFLPYIIIE